MGVGGTAGGGQKGPVEGRRSGDGSLRVSATAAGSVSRYVKPPPERGGVGQRRHGQGSQGVGLVPTVSEQERVWKVSQLSVLVSC